MSEPKHTWLAVTYNEGGSGEHYGIDIDGRCLVRTSTRQLADQIVNLLADNERLREALRQLRDKAHSLFTLATDSIVNTGDGWACKSCGMELDTGGSHKADCCASAILDLNHVLHAAEAALSATERK